MYITYEDINQILNSEHKISRYILQISPVPHPSNAPSLVLSAAQKTRDIKTPANAGLSRNKSRPLFPA